MWLELLVWMIEVGLFYYYRVLINYLIVSEWKVGKFGKDTKVIK